MKQNERFSNISHDIWEKKKVLTESGEITRLALERGI